MICHYNARDNFFFAFKQVNYAIVNQDARGNLGTLRHYVLPSSDDGVEGWHLLFIYFRVQGQFSRGASFKLVATCTYIHLKTICTLVANAKPMGKSEELDISTSTNSMT